LRQGPKGWSMKTSSASSRGRVFPRRIDSPLEPSQSCRFRLLSNVSSISSLSYRPSRNDSNNGRRLQLEDDLQPSASRARPDQLVTILVFLVPTDFIIREEAFDCLLESNAMISKLAALKIILEVRWLEKVPVYQNVPRSPQSGLAAMATADPAFDFLPRESGGRVLHQVGFSPVQFLFLPVMDRYGFGGRRKIIPQILYEPKLLRRTQVKDGGRSTVHSDTPAICFQFSRRERRRQPKTPVVNNTPPELLL